MLFSNKLILIFFIEHMNELKFILHSLTLEHKYLVEETFYPMIRLAWGLFSIIIVNISYYN